MLPAFRTVFSASGTNLRAVFTTAAGTHYRTIVAQIAGIAESVFVVRALVATSAVRTVEIVTFATTLAAVGTKNGAGRTMSAQAHFRTIITQRTGVAKTIFQPCAIITSSAVETYRIATLRTILSALMAYQRAIITTSAAFAYERAVSAQVALFAIITFSRALVAYSATFADIEITLGAMLSASLAHVRTVFALITSGAHYGAIRTQVAGITKVFDTARAIVAFSAFGAEIVIAFVAMLSAVVAQRRAIFTTSAQAQYRTLIAQKTSIAETFFIARAFVATSAFLANIVATFRASLSAFGTQFGAVFAVITSSAYYGTARTQ